MAGKKVGTYMIRFSSKPGYYTITAMESEGQLKHFRIKHRSGTGYFLGSQEYPSLCALLKARKNDLGLKVQNKTKQNKKKKKTQTNTASLCFSSFPFGFHSTTHLMHATELCWLSSSSSSFFLHSIPFRPLLYHIVSLTFCFCFFFCCCCCCQCRNRLAVQSMHS